MALIEWLYNSNTGVIGPVENIMAIPLLHSGLGWHGPFDTKQAAIDFYNRNKAANPGWKAPIGALDVGGAIANAQQSAGERASDALGAFKGLNLEVWFVRIGEIILGIVLIGVGLAKLTGTTNIVSSVVKAKIP